MPLGLNPQPLCRPSRAIQTTTGTSHHGWLKELLAEQAIPNIYIPGNRRIPLWIVSASQPVRVVGLLTSN